MSTRPSRAPLALGLRLAALCSLAIAAISGPTSRAQQADRPGRGTALPMPDPAFRGVSNRTLAGSNPDFPEPVSPPAGAPNVLLILVDDAGFGNASAFGGPCQTPTLSKLASQGLRYNRFHVTALCSPTRAALLSGRNHHAVGFGSIAEYAGGWPGYNSAWPKGAAGVAQILRFNGYNTSIFGKWHLTPDDQQGPAGPFDRWPNSLGFDYFWGFLGGASGQYDPVVAENNTILGVPKGKDYYFPTDMADRAIAWIRDQKTQSPDRPFFMYYTTGASHAPHHVPREWADRYKGKFEQGWDRLREETFARQKAMGVIPANAKLTPRNPAFPAWDSVPEDQKKLFARQMEVFAGFQENCDFEIGRVVRSLDDLGIADDTLIIYIWGDNGASMEGTETGSFNEMTMLNGVNVPADRQLELIKVYGGIDGWGGPSSQPHYASAWAWAGNTPFQWGKQVASHLGGIRDPMVVSWPRRIKDRGGLRSQFTHCTDVVPTILDVAGIPAPKQVDGIEQIPMNGVSFADTFQDPKAPSRHTQQYFEIFGNRAMYKDGWIASAKLDRIPWKIDLASMARFGPSGNWDPDKDKWELYNLDEDFSQSEDLAARYPEKLAELKKLFWEEAEKNHVTPLLAGLSTIYGLDSPGSSRRTFTFYPGSENIGPKMMPQIYNRSYSIASDLEIPAGGAEGVIVAEGDFLGGFALYVRDGRLQHAYSMLGLRNYTMASPDPLPADKVSVRYEFTADEPGVMGTGGKGRLLVDGKPVAENRIEHGVPIRFSSYAGMDIGKDNGDPVVQAYAARSPYPFTGKIGTVVFDLAPLPAPR